MPAPTSEDDLKRRARRRLIGAVALTLVAVIALPLMMEDEPPPAAKLEVRMPVNSKTPDFVPITPPPVTPPVAAVAPEPAAAPPSQSAPAPEVIAPAAPAAQKSAARPEGQKPKPAMDPEVKKPAKPNPPLKDESKTTVEKNTAFVVQLGAFSDASKTRELKQQVDELGLSSYTDKSGELTRLRVGPFTSREAASAAAAKLELAGMHGQVMPK